MILRAFCFVLFISLFQGVSAQELTAQQKAWLYKIVMKTPSLKRNWLGCFAYSGQLPEREVKRVVNGRVIVFREKIWSAIEDSILRNPAILSVDYKTVGSSSPGLIADASVKLALWELYSCLKAGLSEQEPFTINPTANNFYKQMLQVLPADLKKDQVVHKRYVSEFYDLLNPSYPLSTKVYALSQIKKLTAQQQKNILDKWHRLVNAFVEDRSTAYFTLLCSDEVYFDGHLLAAGEGSGSSGLLREYESGGDDRIQTGTGKGVGLFTYTVDVKKGNIVPAAETSMITKALEDEPTLLHLALWGMDGTNKPLILLSRGSRSYLLFADYKTAELCPDPNAAAGVSYLDRLKEYEEEKINKGLLDLNKDNGLLSIQQKESVQRDAILQQINLLELEIDSLNELDEVSELAIDTRRKRIEVHLSNLSAKEKRLASLQQKISAEYFKVDKAREKLSKMSAVLGDNIQCWEVHDSVYTFNDGTIFNHHTQDIIFFPDSTEQEIEVKLLAASFSLDSKRKDEVQLYVNTTGGVAGYAACHAEGMTTSARDTIMRKSYFFEPDEFEADAFFTPEVTERLIEVKRDQMDLVFTVSAHGVDTLNHLGISEDGMNYVVLSQQPRYKNSRRVDIEIIVLDRTCQISISGFADAGNTRLSKLPKGSGIQLKELQTKEQSLNPALSVLRVSSVLKELGVIFQVDFSDEPIFVSPMNKSFVLDR